MGYSSTVLKALGFYTFTCANGIPSNNTNSTNNTNTTTVTSSTLNQTQLAIEQGTSVGAIVAAVVVTVVLTIAAVVTGVICMERRKNRVAND